MSRTHLKTSPLLQAILAERSASFLRQRIYGYASSEKLSDRARQNGFRTWEEF